jgi:hypothetical protein
MNISAYFAERGKRELIKIVSDALVRRGEGDFSDPADDEETFEQMLQALYPPDGFDRKKGGG